MGKMIAFVFSYLGAFMLATVLAVIAGFLIAVPAYYLWNWLMPDLLGLKPVTYWQAWGLFLLCSLLFSRITVTVKGRSNN